MTNINVDETNITTPEKFQVIFENRVNVLRNTLVTKAKEYTRHNDQLHNFRKSANRLSTSMPDVLWRRYCEKHLVSIDDIILDIKEGKIPTKEVISEKLGDIIAYAFLLEACFNEYYTTNITS